MSCRCAVIGYNNPPFCRGPVALSQNTYSSTSGSYRLPTRTISGHSYSAAASGTGGYSATRSPARSISSHSYSSTASGTGGYYASHSPTAVSGSLARPWRPSDGRPTSAASPPRWAMPAWQPKLAPPYTPLPSSPGRGVARPASSPAGR